MKRRGGPPSWMSHGFPSSQPPPPGPQRGWYDTPPPWRGDFVGPPRPPPSGDFDEYPPPPPPKRPTPSSFADDDFDIPPPPPPPNPPRGRGRGGSMRGGNQIRGKAPFRGIPNPRGRPQTRGSMNRGANLGRGTARGTFNPRGAPFARGANRGAPGRGVRSRGAGIGRGRGRGWGNSSRGGTSSSNGGSNNRFANTIGEDIKGPQLTETTVNSSQAATDPANQTAGATFSNSNVNNKSFLMLDKAKKEQKKGQNVVLKASVPGEANFISFKNSLQECCQKQHLAVPAYKTWKNAYGYSAKVEVAENTFKSTGIQSDHKEAQQNAAYYALLNMGLIDSTVSFDVKTAAAIKRPAIDNSIVDGVSGKRVKMEVASPVATSYKSRLNEFCQKFRFSIPSYDTVKADNGKGFITTIVFNKKVYQSNGSQPTKKLAEQNAAQVVLHMLNQCPAPAPSYQDFVEHCKKLSSQNTTTESTTKAATTTVTTTSASAQQIPLPTAAPNLLGVSTVTTSQTSTTSVSSSFSGPTVEKITVPDHQPPVAATTAQVKPQPTFTSHKNYLQEYCQKNKVALPVYSSVRENGVFTCTVQVAGKSFTSNGCNTKKGSEQTAASVALKGLGLAQL